MSSRAAKKRTRRAENAKTLKEAFAPLTELMFRQMDEREAELDKFPLVRAMRKIVAEHGGRPEGLPLDIPVEVTIG